MELTLTVQAARPAAVIGNTRTAALIGADGALEWLAFPDADAEPCFDAGADAATVFALAPEGHVSASREYVGETPVLRTHWQAEGASAAVVDFLPLRTGPANDPREPRFPQHRVIRMIEGLEGEMVFHFRIAPRVAGLRPELVEDPNGLLFAWPDRALVLQTAGEVVLRPDGTVDGRVRIQRGQRHTFMLTWHDTSDPDVPEVASTVPDWELDGTYEFWLAWGRQCPFRGPQRDHVLRLLALLKAWTPAAGHEPGQGAPPFFGGPWRRLAPVALAAWGFEDELSAAMKRWTPDPASTDERIQAAWLLDAFATGNASGLLDQFAWLPAWPALARVADALAAEAERTGTQAHDMAVAVGLAGAAALADDLMLDGDQRAWRTAAAAAAARLGEGARGPAGDAAGAGDPQRAYWVVRHELREGAFLQARRQMDAFLQAHVPVTPGAGPDLGGLAAMSWLAAQLYLQGPPKPERVELPGDLGT